MMGMAVWHVYGRKKSGPWRTFGVTRDEDTPPN